MKNDRYFPLEICFWADDNLSVMMYQIGGVQLVGIYVLLLYLCAKNNYSKSVVNSMQKPVEKSAVEKTSETPMDKGRKPNETQESRVEEKRNITTVVNNSSNIGEERKTAAVVARTSDSVNDRGNEIVSPRLDPVQSTSCFCSAHGSSLLVPRVKYGLPTACRNSPTVCGNSPAACGDFHPRLLLQGFFQSGNRLFRVFFFFEQSDELTADDSSGSVFASCLECCFIGDTKSHHQRIVQMHIFNLFEVSPFLFVEILLRSGGCC